MAADRHFYVAPSPGMAGGPCARPGCGEALFHEVHIPPGDTAARDAAITGRASGRQGGRDGDMKPGGADRDTAARDGRKSSLAGG